MCKFAISLFVCLLDQTKKRSFLKQLKGKGTDCIDHHLPVSSSPRLVQQNSVSFLCSLSFVKGWLLPYIRTQLQETSLWPSEIFSCSARPNREPEMIVHICEVDIVFSVVSLSAALVHVTLRVTNRKENCYASLVAIAQNFWISTILLERDKTYGVPFCFRELSYIENT